jgi:predicted nucleotidyltransferase
MSKKPAKRAKYKEVIYNDTQWALLKELREKAVRIMNALETFRLRSVVHGSIARGDVNKSSDVDVFITEAYSSFLVETALERAGMPVARGCWFKPLRTTP